MCHMCHKVSADEDVSKTHAESSLVYLMLINIGQVGCLLTFLLKVQKAKEWIRSKMHLYCI